MCRWGFSSGDGVLSSCLVWSCVCRRLGRCLHGLLLLWLALRAMLACALECDEDAIRTGRLEMCVILSFCSVVYQRNCSSVLLFFV